MNEYRHFLKDLSFLLHQKSFTPGRYSSWLKLVVDPSIYILFNYRISHLLSNHKLLIVGKLFWAFNYFFFKVDIDPRAQLGGGCIFVHPMGIVVGANVRTVGYIKIYQGVTVGGAFDQPHMRMELS